MSKYLAGIDVGGTNIKVGLFDFDMNLVCKGSVETFAETGAEEIIGRIAGAVEGLLEQCGGGLSELAAAGVGTPGPADYKAGILYSLANMPGFKDVPVKRMVGEALQCPVGFDNDANVACLGEFVSGAGSDVDDMVFFTLGTGIGAGVISDGKLIRGCGGNGGELGHMIIFPDGRQCGCGQRGCVEAYASASSTAARAMEEIEKGASSSLKAVLDEKGAISCKDVYEHLAGGDPLAKEITELTAKALGILCVNVLHFTEPERIVFAGGMIGSGDVLLDGIKRHFADQIWELKQETVEICFATLGGDAGIVGAAALGKEALGL